MRQRDFLSCSSRFSSAARSLAWVRGKTYPSTPHRWCYRTGSAAQAEPKSELHMMDVAGILSSKTTCVRASILVCLADPSFMLQFVLVSLKQHITTNHSFTRGVSSFRAWRALLARRLSAASRPLATGPSKRWTAADHLQRLSSIGRAGRRSATPWHCWPGSRVADHPCRHPCQACLKQRMAANGIITFLESSRGSTALLWRLY